MDEGVEVVEEVEVELDDEEAADDEIADLDVYDQVCYAVTVARRRGVAGDIRRGSVPSIARYP
jgi:hypothetical protein